MVNGSMEYSLNLKEGVKVFLLKAATRPVIPTDGQEAVEAMKRLGAQIISGVP